MCSRLYRNNMPVLRKHKHELFAQGLAKGLSADAAYQAAGYKRDRGNATRLTANDSIQKRVVEIQDKAAENVEVSKAWVMERLKEIVERAMQAVPHLDHEGNPTGVYTYQGNVAIKALEMLGRELGMFAQRQPRDEDNPQMLRVLIDKPPDETREQWIARRSRELGVAPAALIQVTGSTNRRDSG
jgi:phage terminase small subunit